MLRSLTLALLLPSCTPEEKSDPDPTEYEGDDAGECSDAADNDRDGDFDCDDDDCVSSPDCEAGENAAPGAPTVEVTPPIPTTADDLVCAVTVEAEDPDGDPVTYTFSWTVDGAEAGVTIDTVPAASTTTGETWSCVVVASDGTLESSPATASVTIANTPPTGLAVSIEPAAPGDDDDLVCTVTSAATDADGDPVTVAYAWSVDGIDAGVATATVVAALTGPGQAWSCTATPSDGTDAGDAATASVVIDTNDNAPSVPTVGITPEGPLDDDDLTCGVVVESVDPDGDAVAYAYTWLRDGVATGDTAATISAAATTPGEVWTCSVTATDGDLSSGAATADATILSSGCADGSSEADEARWARTDIVFCDGGTGALPVDPADAETLCATGWHLCTAAEFVDRNDACAEGHAFSGVIDDGTDCMVHDDGGSHDDGGWDCDADTYNIDASSYVGTCTSATSSAPSSMLGFYEDFSSGAFEGALCCQ